MKRGNINIYINFLALHQLLWHDFLSSWWLVQRKALIWATFFLSLERFICYQI